MCPPRARVRGQQRRGLAQRACAARSAALCVCGLVAGDGRLTGDCRYCRALRSCGSCGSHRSATCGGGCVGAGVVHGPVAAGRRGGRFRSPGDRWGSPAAGFVKITDKCSAAIRPPFPAGPWRSGGSRGRGAAAIVKKSDKFSATRADSSCPRSIGSSGAAGGAGRACGNNRMCIGLYNGIVICQTQTVNIILQRGDRRVTARDHARRARLAPAARAGRCTSPRSGGTRLLPRGREVPGSSGLAAPANSEGSLTFLRAPRERQRRASRRAAETREREDGGTGKDTGGAGRGSSPDPADRASR